MKAAAWAAGRWPEIIAALVGEHYVDGKHHPCPHGDGKDCFRFSDLNGRGNFFCRCSDGSSDGFDLIRCAQHTDFAGAVKLVEGVIGPRPRDDDHTSERRPSYAQRLRREARTVKASRYLAGRGLIVAPGLQWHPAVEYRDDGEVIGTYPAMLAPITRSGRFLTYHVTYLDNGGKAPVEPCRKILPGPGLKGAAVELFPIGPTLGIAEGIETAIAAHILFDLPTWAALNTSLLQSWRPPESVERVVIFGDNDHNYAGQAAVYTLAHRLHGHHHVELRFPDHVGDWNDVLLNERRASNG